MVDQSWTVKEPTNAEIDNVNISAKKGVPVAVEVVYHLVDDSGKTVKQEGKALKYDDLVQADKDRVDGLITRALAGVKSWEGFA